MRYFYKHKNNYLSLKSPILNPAYEQITAEEFYEAKSLCRPKRNSQAVVKEANCDDE